MKSNDLGGISSEELEEELEEELLELEEDEDELLDEVLEELELDFDEEELMLDDELEEELLEEDSLETLGSELGWLAETLEEDDVGEVPQAAKSIAMAIAKNKDLLPFIVIPPKVAKNIPYKNIKSNVGLPKEKQRRPAAA